MGFITFCDSPELHALVLKRLAGRRLFAHFAHKSPLVGARASADHHSGIEVAVVSQIGEHAGGRFFGVEPAQMLGRDWPVARAPNAVAAAGVQTGRPELVLSKPPCEKSLFFLPKCFFMHRLLVLWVRQRFFSGESKLSRDIPMEQQVSRAVAQFTYSILLL